MHIFKSETLHFPTLTPIIDLMLNRFTAYSQYQPPPVSLLQIGGIDARSVQKTPAGVLVVRRGLFFVKRQRRYAAYLQKGQKGLDTRVVGCTILTAHSSQLTAHSSQREYPLERFLFCNHTHPYFFSVYTHRLTAKALRSQRAVPFLPISTYFQNPKDSAENSAWHNYHLRIIHYPLLSSFYRNARYALWFDTG